MAMKNPPHPGRIVKEDCLPELDGRRGGIGAWRQPPDARQDYQ